MENQAAEVNDKEARLYAVAIAEQLNRDEINVIFNEVVRKSKVPMIITDNHNVPINWNNIVLNFWKQEKSKVPQVPFLFLNKMDQDALMNLIKKFDQKNKPLELAAEGHIFGVLHYGEITLVPILSWTPLAEFVIIFLFLILGYVGVYIIRSNEQSVLWVGLAKETAHQLGTPISSLLGWLDYLKMKMEGTPEAEKQLQILREMESDISRLNRVATRFSQIGSIPELKKQDLNSTLVLIVEYFQSRLPHLGKKITLELKQGPMPEIWFNRELIGWVFENLIRNAVDSIEVNNGAIKITTASNAEQDKVFVTVVDNGKGIPKENLKRIFNPGFTTKKRGWGLGLSLCRRIVQDYHDGKIYVEKSSRESGTEFKITLPVSPERINRKKS